MNVRVVLSVAIAVIAVWGGAASQLDVLFGKTASQLIVAACSLTVASLAAALGVLSTQASQVNNVTNDPSALLAALQKMPGIDKVLVNAQASPTLASAAVTPDNAKIVPTDTATQRKLVDIAAKS